MRTTVDIWNFTICNGQFVRQELNLTLKAGAKAESFAIGFSNKMTGIQKALAKGMLEVGDGPLPHMPK